MTLTLKPQTEARLSGAAAQRGLTVGEMVDRAVEALLAEEAEGKSANSKVFDENTNQAARQAILADILLKAQALEPEMPDSPARKAYREDAAGQAVVEKYRRQGFNL